MEIQSPLTRKRIKSKWTAEEIEFVKTRTQDAINGSRMSPKELALLPEMWRHTWQSIATRLKRHGFADQVRSARIKSSCKLTCKKKKEVRHFLRNTGRYWPSAIAAEHLGVSRKQVIRTRRALRIPFGHSDEAMKDPVYRKWYKGRELCRVANLREAFRERPKHRRLELEEEFQHLIRSGKLSRKLRMCMKCKTRWPRMSNFFTTFKRRSAKGETYVVLRWICKACPISLKNRKA